LPGVFPCLDNKNRRDNRYQKTDNKNQHAGINPSAASSKLMRLFVIEGSSKQTMPPMPAKTINKIPIIKAAIFILVFLQKFNCPVSLAYAL